MKLITYVTFIQNLAYASLPTQQKSTLLSRVSTHTSADCEISGRQPTRLEKEFPRIHNALHPKKTMLISCMPRTVGYSLAKSIKHLDLTVMTLLTLFGLRHHWILGLPVPCCALWTSEGRQRPPRQESRRRDGAGTAGMSSKTPSST